MLRFCGFVYPAGVRRLTLNGANRQAGGAGACPGLWFVRVCVFPAKPSLARAGLRGSRTLDRVRVREKSGVALSSWFGCNELEVELIA